MKTRILILALWLICACAIAQDFNWIEQKTGVTMVYSSTTDVSGNLYVVAKADASLSTIVLDAQSATLPPNKMFMAKFDGQGDAQWITPLSSYDYLSRITMRYHDNSTWGGVYTAFNHNGDGKAYIHWVSDETGGTLGVYDAPFQSSGRIIDDFETDGTDFYFATWGRLIKTQSNMTELFAYGNTSPTPEDYFYFQLDIVGDKILAIGYDRLDPKYVAMQSYVYSPAPVSVCEIMSNTTDEFMFTDLTAVENGSDIEMYATVLFDEEITLGSTVMAPVDVPATTVFGQAIIKTELSAGTMSVAWERLLADSIEFWNVDEYKTMMHGDIVEAGNRVVVPTRHSDGRPSILEINKESGAVSQLYGCDTRDLRQPTIVKAGDRHAYITTAFHTRTFTETGTYAGVSLVDGNIAMGKLNLCDSDTAYLGEDDMVCGEPIQLSPGSFSSYYWSTGATTPTISASAVGTYSVTVTDSKGCETTDDIQLANGKYYELESAYTVPAEGKMCIGDSVLLVPGSSDPISYMQTVEWFNASGDKLPSESVDAAYAKEPGDYWAVATSVDGCKDTLAETIHIDWAGTGPVDLIEDTSSCEAIIVISPPSGYFTDHWSNGSIGNLAATTSGTYTLYAKQYDSDIDEWCYSEDSIDVTIASPTSFTLSQTDDYLCNGPVTITPSISDAGDYNWSNGESTRINTVASSGVYSLTFTNVDGCEYTQQAVVNLTSNPSVDLGGDDSFCGAGSKTLDAGAWDSYSWSTGSSSRTISATSAGTYSVTITDENGCEGSDGVVISRHDNPTIELGEDIEECNDDNVTLDAGAWDSYSWSTGADSRSVDVSSGTYSVTITDANGCEGTDDVTVTLHSVPVLDLGNTEVIPDTSSVTIDAGEWSTYSWDNGHDGRYLDVVGQDVGPGFHTYALSVTDANGCEASDYANVDVFHVDTGTVLAIDMAEEIDFSVYPNPTSGPFSVSISGYGEARIAIYDVTGAVVYESGIHVSGSEETSIYAPEMSHGMYIISVEMGDATNTARLLVK